MNNLIKKCKLTGVEIARVCGRFSRLKEESKKPIGYSSLAEMAVIHTLRKAIPIIRAEGREDESLDRITYLGDEYTRDGRPLVDEVVLSNATVHLESLSDQDFMLIVDNEKYHWHLVICAGSRRSKIYAIVMEEENKALKKGEA